MCDKTATQIRVSPCTSGWDDERAAPVSANRKPPLPAYRAHHMGNSTYQRVRPSGMLASMPLSARAGFVAKIIAEMGYARVNRWASKSDRLRTSRNGGGGSRPSFPRPTRGASGLRSRPAEAPERFGGRRVSPLLKLTASQSFNRITKECVDYTNAFGLTRPASLPWRGAFHCGLCRSGDETGIGGHRVSPHSVQGPTSTSASAGFVAQNIIARNGLRRLGRAPLIWGFGLPLAPFRVEAKSNRVGIVSNFVARIPGFDFGALERSFDIPLTLPLII